jgi:hypothetical protein
MSIIVNPMEELILDEDIDYAYEFIKDVCTTIGPGCPCSPQEIARGMKVKDELEKNVQVDDVHAEEFTCAPNAFLGWFQPAVLLAVGAMVCFYLSLDTATALLFSTIALAIAVFIIVVVIFQFILTREVIDFMYPKKKSINIAGKLGPRDDVQPKRIIIFGGHHDSALKFTWLQYLRAGYIVAVVILFLTVLLITALLAIRFIAVLAGFASDWVSILLYITTWTLLPATFVIAWFFTERGKNGGPVPGAIDNLSAVACVLAMGRIVKRNPELIPADTELRFVSFGCEEAGERGSGSYVKSHLAELREKDAVCFNFESIYEPEITIFSSDCNGLVKHDPELVKAVDEAATAAGVKHDIKPFFFGGGGTDAMKFSENHIKSMSLFGLKVPADFGGFYHQTRDNYDKVNKESLKNALKIAVAYLQRFK